MTSFVCRTDGQLLSGEAVTDAVQAIAPLRVVGMLINCTPATTIHEPFAELLAAVRALPTPPPITGLYANIGHTNEMDGWTHTAEVAPMEYARLATAWLRQGANLVGGCCGTTPAHIAAVRMLIG
jgi:S-methylmethionine-dependent homocysteine/selenocysteine methylase